VDNVLSRNGLRYGKTYGFAIDTTVADPTQRGWRDSFHKDATTGMNCNIVSRKWMFISWQLDGTVQNFEHDGLALILISQHRSNLAEKDSWSMD
jgi:hypothetical protein